MSKNHGNVIHLPHEYHFKRKASFTYKLVFRKTRGLNLGHFVDMLVDMFVDISKSLSGQN